MDAEKAGRVKGCVMSGLSTQPLGVGL